MRRLLVRIPKDFQWIFSQKGRLKCRKTPRKINMEHNDGGLEDDLPCQRRDFSIFFGSMLNLPR